MNLAEAPLKQLEYWNSGMMEQWVMGNWWSGFIGVILLTRKLVNEKLPYKLAECIYGLKSTFQSSTIPSFHVWGKFNNYQKTLLTSISCRNSETFNYSKPNLLKMTEDFGKYRLSFCTLSFLHNQAVGCLVICIRADLIHHILTIRYPGEVHSRK